MNYNIDNKIFVTYCSGLTCFFAGGLLYNIIVDVCQKNKFSIISWKKSQDKTDVTKVYSFMNVGGLFGGILGVSFGYYGKPLIPLLIEKVVYKNIE